MVAVNHTDTQTYEVYHLHVYVERHVTRDDSFLSSGEKSGYDSGETLMSGGITFSFDTDHVHPVGKMIA